MLKSPILDLFTGFNTLLKNICSFILKEELPSAHLKKFELPTLKLIGLPVNLLGTFSCYR
jgi:hypothetical protein